MFYADEDVVVPKTRTMPSYTKRVNKQNVTNFVNSEVYQNIKKKLEFEEKQFIGNHVNFLLVYKEEELMDLDMQYNYTQLQIPRAFG